MFKTDHGVIKPVTYVGIIRDDQLLLVDYAEPPNPTREGGWWIPAPGLQFGQSPEDSALEVLKELGISDARPELKDIESFVTPGGWHLVYHYIARVNRDITPNANIRNYKWVKADELPEPRAFAHGQWERALARFFLEQ